MTDPIFGEVISTYTDRDAIEDGILVDTAALRVKYDGLVVNRMTVHLWGALEEFLVKDDIVREMASTLRTKVKYARPSRDNTGEVGDIVTIPPELWLVRNEVGGWTAMFPADY